MSPPNTATGTAIITTAAHTALGIQPIRIQASVDAYATSARWSLVGLPDVEHTTRDRLRAAVLNSGQVWPLGSVSLAVVGQGLPALDSGVDLACGLALLAATGRIPAGYLDQVACCGELGLDGAIRSVRGLDQRIVALQRAGFHRLILPAAQAPNSLPGQLVIWPATHLREVTERLRTAEHAEASEPGLDELADPRLRRMATIAAAGGHHLLLAGCTEERAAHVSRVLAGLLPDLDDQTARDVGDLHWRAGRPRAIRSRLRPPWIGALPPLTAGADSCPGPASLAHHGVWCPADPHTLTADQVMVLRSVFDQRRVGVRDHQTTRSWPARTQLVLATSGEASTARLRAIADRVDLHLNLGVPDDLAGSSAADCASALAAEQVGRARMAAARRWSPQSPDHPTCNAEIAPADLQRALHLLPGAYLRRNADVARLSARGWVGVLRLAWTIADLDGRGHPDRAAVDEAIAWRTGGLGQR